MSELFDLPAALFLLDLDNSTLHLAAARPETYGKNEKMSFELGSHSDNPLAGVVYHRFPAAILATEWPGEAPLPTTHLAATPLKVRDSVTGVLVLGGDGPFSMEELAALEELGSRVGSAVHVAEAFTDSINRGRRHQHPSIAAELQQDSLPPGELYTARAGIAGAIEPAYDIGGDWFDYALNDDRLFVAVCDAVGRGIEAAAVASISLGAVRNARRKGYSLPEIMHETHRAVISSTSSEQFATLLVAEIDLTERRMQLIDAGHPCPIIVDENGDASVLPCSPIYPPVGSLDEGASYEPRTYELEPGSRLLFISDGIPECRNSQQVPLGNDRLLRFAQQGANLPPLHFIRSIMDSVLAFSDGPLRDDATIVGVDLNYYSEPEEE